MNSGRIEISSIRLLDTAIDQFGRFGLDGASTRAIAKASDTTMSAITYHFGSKRGLYLAAADRIVAAIVERQFSTLRAVDGLPDQSPRSAIDGCITLLDSFAAMMMSAESAPWSRFIIREQFEPTEAFDRIWNGVMQCQRRSKSRPFGGVKPGHRVTCRGEWREGVARGPLPPALM